MTDLPDFGFDEKTKASSDAKFCYECDKPGHTTHTCPVLQKNREGKIRFRADHVPVEQTVEELLSTGRISTGINFDLFEKIKVEKTTAVDYTPLKSFDGVHELNILRQNIQNLVNWRKPTPIQQHAIPLILEGCDLMACAQTGSGKTGAFLLPVIAKMHESSEENFDFKYTKLLPFEPEAVILAPTRELAIQISEEARILAQGTSVKSCCLYGGTSPKIMQERLLDSSINMLIATPGRLADFIRCGYINLRSKCQYIVLDEADRMLDMGFKKSVDFIAENSKPIGDRQTLMFSATFPKPVQKLAHTFLRRDHPFIAVGIVGSANRDVRQIVEKVDSHLKKDRLLEILDEDLANNPRVRTTKGEIYEKKTLIFIQTVSKVVSVHEFLESQELPVACLHGRISQFEREKILKNFKSGLRPVLLATAIAARGLDIVGVDHVINYDMPKNIDEYVHKIGRTGRIGNVGRATSFYDANRDAKIARYMVKILSDAQQEVPDFLQALDRYIGDAGIGKRLAELKLDWD